MAQIYVRPGVTVTRVGSDSGGPIAARGGRDGALVVLNEYDGLVREGRVFCASGGSGTSPITFAGAYDADAPDLSIDIPDGTIAIPLFFQVVIETSGASMFEIIMMASRTLTAVTAGTAVTPTNMRLDAPVSTVSTVYAAVDAAGCTDPNTAGAVEFFRSGYPTDPDVAGNPTLEFTWSAKNHGPGPIIVDGGSFVIYAAGTSGTGFVKAIWAELPESALV